MKLKTKTSRVELTGDFTGIWLDIITNPPMRVYEEFASGEIARIMAALAAMTRASNLTAEDDAPIDLATTDGWRAVPSEFMKEVGDRVTETLSVPKATSNGSATPSSQAEVSSLGPTT